MKMRIEAFCLGYRLANPNRVFWGAVLLATADDGREKKSNKFGVLPDDTTKNVADLIAATKTLQCIKSEFRATTDIILHAPPGYATQMLERNPDGLWGAIPRSNLSNIEDLRTMANKYAKLEVRKGNINHKITRELISFLQEQVSHVGMAAD